MNKHLQYVRNYRENFSLPQAEFGGPGHMSDMDIVLCQAVLLESGSETFRSLKKGDMSEILGDLAQLAYCALNPVAMQGGDVIERRVFWRHDGSILSVMRLLSDNIHRCSSGLVIDYSTLYCSCKHLACNFLNADFDRAMQLFHEAQMADTRGLRSFDQRLASPTADFSECLYE